MHLTVMRHGDFSPMNKGNPTPSALRKLLHRASKLVSPGTVVVCSEAPRTLVPAQHLCQQHQLPPPLVIPYFNPLVTTSFPPVFGGALYETLHRSPTLNQLGLMLWWKGVPLFTERPIQFCKRIELGLEAVKQTGVENVFMVGHLENIFVIEVKINKTEAVLALKMRIPYLHTATFNI